MYSLYRLRAVSLACGIFLIGKAIISGRKLALMLAVDCGLLCDLVHLFWG